jgi:hypothetical protein
VHFYISITYSYLQLHRLFCPSVQQDHALPTLFHTPQPPFSISCSSLCSAFVDVLQFIDLFSHTYSFRQSSRCKTQLSQPHMTHSVHTFIFYILLPPYMFVATTTFHFPLLHDSLRLDFASTITALGFVGIDGCRIYSMLYRWVHLTRCAIFLTNAHHCRYYSPKSHPCS